jgi:gamma-glutamyltranspeptidase
MIAGGMDPQAAAEDKSRFCMAFGTQDGVVQLEEGVSEAVINELIARGHKLEAGVSGHSRSLFVRAKVVKKDCSNGVLWAGSDGHVDGCAMGF